MQKQIAITVIVAILVGGAGFFGGIQYQKTKAATVAGNGQQFFQYTQGGQRRGGNRGFGGMATIGKILSVDSNSMTVQLQDGSSKIVNISTSTRIEKTNTAAVSDLAKDTQVAVFGTTNSDGSVTAQNIQINPQQLRGLRPSGSPIQTQ